MLLTMSDVGVRVVELRERKRGGKLPTVLGRQVKEQAWPLRHLDFSLEDGQTVYVLDLATHRPALFLRLATGTLRCDEGTITLPPRSLLARPAGRRQVRSLSVGQSIRMMAGLYGMGDKAIDRRFDEMVDFAEVSRVVNRPIESQHRQVIAQVAFAAAICSRAELIAFDRCALVGDRRFRNKCARRIAELKKSGTGFVVFSPDARQVLELADRGLVLDGDHSREVPPAELAGLLIADKKEQRHRHRKRRRRRRKQEGDSGV